MTTAAVTDDPILIMSAPNGARKTKADHANLPITPDEVAAEAHACFEAGAAALHLHVRDETDGHSLDPDRYRTALSAVRKTVPQMLVQITTEAVGRYSPADQRAVVENLKPDAASIALRELFPENRSGDKEGFAFISDCKMEQIALQWIVYDTGDLSRLRLMAADGRFGDSRLRILMVLGRYTTSQEGKPRELLTLLSGMDAWPGPKPVWSVCAFGRRESACLATAITLGGHVRVGFENNMLRANGSVAASNAERVSDIASLASALGYHLATGDDAATILGISTND